MGRKAMSLLLSSFLIFAFMVNGSMAATKKISLVKGWNLISSPLQPTSTDTTDVLSGVSSCVSAWKWVGGGNWAVYLADGNNATETYAASKGFKVLSTINAGEGLWINASDADALNITGESPSSSSIYYEDGWNLVGLKESGPKNITDVIPGDAVSAWSWNASDMKWRVWLPTGLDDYCSSKGFDKLSTVNNTDGFWVNTTKGTYEGPVEMPPAVGKVYLAGEDNTYNPLPNAEVYADGKLLGVTDDQGIFDVSTVPDGAAIEVKADGYTVGTGKKGNGVVFVQKLDPKKGALSKNYDEDNQTFTKPTPKPLSSSDGKTVIVVGEDMKLKKDITVSITTYNTPVAAPAYNLLGKDNIEPGKDVTDSLVVLGGADLKVFDSNGAPYTLTSDEFSATLKASTTQILGGIGEALNAYTKPMTSGVENITKAAYEKFKEQVDSGQISLYTMEYDVTNAKWLKAGPAKVIPYKIKKKIYDNNGTYVETKEYEKYALTTGDGVSLSKIAPFAFVIKYEYLIGEVSVSLKEGGYKMSDGSIVTKPETGADPFKWIGNPIKGVMGVGDENAVNAGVTGADGIITLKYKTPYFSPVVDFIFKKEGYFDTTLQVNVFDYYKDKTTKQVVMYRIPDTASVEGYVKEKLSQDPIGGALVSLMNPDVLDDITYSMDDKKGIVLSTEYKPNTEYTWEYRKKGTKDWKKLTPEKGKEYMIYGSMVRDAVIGNWTEGSDTDPTGLYELRVHVTHKYDNNNDGVFDTFYDEEALGHFEVLVDQNKLKEKLTGSISEYKVGDTGMNQIGIFGGSELGWYYAVGPVANEYTPKWTTRIQAAASKAMFDSNTTNVKEDELTSMNGVTNYINVLAESAPVVDAFYPYVYIMNQLTTNFMKLLEKDPYNPSKSFFQSGFTVANLFSYKYKTGSGKWAELNAASYFDLPEDAITDPKDLLLIPTLEIVPNTTFAYLRQIYSKDDGFYRFNLVPYEYNNKLEVAGEKAGYKPDYKFLNDLEKGKVSHYDLYLKKIAVKPKDIVFTFEPDAGEGNWTVTQPSNVASKWQILENAQNVYVDKTLVGYINYPDEVTDTSVYTDTPASLKVDTNGTIIWTDKANHEATLEVGGTEYPVYVYDNDGDGKFDPAVDQIENATNATTVGEVWVDVNGNIKFTTKGDGTPAVSLLPAFEGTHYLWFGNKALGAFTDNTNNDYGNTSNYVQKGTVVSPVLDLTDFSFATLEFESWFETESVDIAKGEYDQMYIEVAVIKPDGETSDTVTIKSPGGSYTVKYGEFKVVGMMNPDTEPGWQNQSPVLNYSTGGPDAVPVWSSKIVNLHPYAGHKIQLRFNFFSKDKLYNAFRGWGIDLVKVKNEINIALPPSIPTTAPTTALSREHL